MKALAKSQLPNKADSSGELEELFQIFPGLKAKGDRKARRQLSEEARDVIAKVSAEKARSKGDIDFEERTFYSAPSSREDAKYFLETFLKKFPRTTLIAVDSDNGAELLHTAALQLNLECPGQIALTGFGNISPLPIANVNQAPERQGELAARYLIEHALTGKLPETSHIRVETRLEKIEQIPIILS
jgi:DNA-binding LacI/PurR family transcriptional regulator